MDLGQLAEGVRRGIFDIGWYYAVGGKFNSTRDSSPNWVNAGGRSSSNRPAPMLTNLRPGRGKRGHEPTATTERTMLYIGLSACGTLGCEMVSSGEKRDATVPKPWTVTFLAPIRIFIQRPLVTCT